MHDREDNMQIVECHISMHTLCSSKCCLFMLKKKDTQVVESHMFMQKLILHESAYSNKSTTSTYYKKKMRDTQVARAKCVYACSNLSFHATKRVLLVHAK